uniref:LRRNT domain-containing protein n=1 Tax=Octopus bimaculoides TaxID=37653 RepID=A0A0L8HJS3_OCTBM
MLRELNMLTVVLILYMGLFLESHVAVSDICSKCVCNLDVNCSSRGLSSIPKGLPINITSL